MSDRTADDAAARPDGGGPAAIARLLDEIRHDAGWRDEVTALRERAAAAPAAADGAAAAVLAPAPDPALEAALGALEVAIRLADAPIEIGGGRPVVGEAMAAVRRRVHAEIRLSQDRQTVVNGQLAAALRRLQAALDPADPGAALGTLWGELARLAGRLAAAEARLAGLEGATTGASRLDRVEENLEAVARELEPLGALRAAVGELERRLARLEATT